jgi:S-adenosylmethionine synthetase
MQRNIVIEELKQPPIDQRKVEVVERKGLGHPDYICDSISNAVSVALCKEYLRKFGAIAHHNIDKGLLVAGQAAQRFGGGRIVSPMLFVFGDRATFEIEGQAVPVSEIAISTAKSWFKENLRFVDPDRHVKYQIELKKGSAALRDIFARKGAILGANDTSAAVGYAPMTATEQIVLATERYLNSRPFKKRFPESGEDIKIMGLRVNNKLKITVAMPLIDRFVESETDYFRKKAVIAGQIAEFVKAKAEEAGLRSSLDLNTLDRPGRGLAGCYLTVTGTSAEDADCGQVGRGNRVNGIIPLNRPISSEAAAGKNPVSHVGKIYNALTYRIAAETYRAVPDIKEVYIWLLSQIGVPIDRPMIAAAQVIMERGRLDRISGEIQAVIDRELQNIQRFCMDLAYGRVAIC